MGCFGWVAAANDFGRTPIALGNSFTLVIEIDGSVKSWGRNDQGQLGDGTFVQKLVPGTVASLSGIVGLAAGDQHAVAVRYDGAVFTWGLNSSGQLGINPAGVPNRASAVQVSGISGVVQVVAGDNFVVALKADGTVWAWGNNAYSQLGRMAGAFVFTPVQITQLSSVVSLSAGSRHAMAVTSNGTLYAWGDNASGQIGTGTTGGVVSSPTAVGSLTNVIASAGGDSHSAALLADGTVRTWGANLYGQLGIGTTTPRATPGVVSNLTFVERIAATRFNTVAVAANGVAYVCGQNDQGQAGNGLSSGTILTPVPISSTARFLGAAVGLGDIALVDTGGLTWLCGGNASGQLGNNTLTPRTQFASLALSLRITSWTRDFAGGEAHSASVSPNGLVATWGSNGVGQLGNGGLPDQSIAGPVSNLENIKSVTCGSFHTVALRADGTVWSWGANYFGALGDGTTTQRGVPVQIPGLSNVISVAAGAWHTVALRADGTFWAWGLNAQGQLGRGAGFGNPALSPVQITTLSGVRAMAAGEYHSFAIKGDGTVWSWGNNSSGQLGINSRTSQVAPVQVAGLVATMISAGRAHSLFLDNAGLVKASGDGSYGQVGAYPGPLLVPTNVFSSTAIWIAASSDASFYITQFGIVVWLGRNLDNEAGGSGLSYSPAPQPLQVGDPGSLYASRLAAGSFHILANTNSNFNPLLTGSEFLVAWGRNASGQLGLGTITASSSFVMQPPTPAFADPTHSFSALILRGMVVGGGGFGLALRADGTVWSWGTNTVGQLGRTTGDLNVPEPIMRLSSVALVSAGNGHSLAVTQDGRLFSWGYNAFGQLGAISSDLTSPRWVSSLSDVVSASAGGTFSVAARSDGSVWEWGLLNSFTTVSTPKLIGNTGATSVSAGGNHFLVLAGAGTVWGAGDNSKGQLGLGNTTSQGTLTTIPNQPAAFGNSPVIAIAAGYSHSVALTAAGTVWTWGDDSLGQLGDGVSVPNTLYRSTPYQVLGLSNITKIAAGANHTVALKSDGTVYAWGDNSSGQLGFGSATPNYRSSPWPVSGLSGPVVAIGAGNSHSIAVLANGSVVSWGSNTSGELGTVSVPHNSTPTTLPVATQSPNLIYRGTPTVSLTLSNLFYANNWPVVVNIRATVGGAWQTGRISRIDLLDGTSVIGSITPSTAVNNATYNLQFSGFTRGVHGLSAYVIDEQALSAISSPVLMRVFDAFSQAMSSGDSHTLALDGQGGVKAWGSNIVGQLGDGTTNPRSSPAPVPGLQGIVQVAAGINGSAALAMDGTVWMWGSNQQGILGDDSTAQYPIYRPAPGPVPNLQGIVSVSAGWNQMLALRSDGRVFVWGSNSYGEIAQVSSTNYVSHPVELQTIPPALGVFAGKTFSFATTLSGSAYGWGANESGQLGTGTTVSPLYSPATVANLTNVIEMDGGVKHTVALTNDGRVWTFGDNQYGQLGVSSGVTSRATPAALPPFSLATITSVSAGYYYTLALANNGTVYGWGHDSKGQLGNGQSGSGTYLFAPVQVLSLTNAAAISAGSYSSFAFDTQGRLFAWGWNSSGQLGDGTTTDRSTRVQIAGFGPPSDTNGIGPTITLIEPAWATLLP